MGRDGKTAAGHRMKPPRNTRNTRKVRFCRLTRGPEDRQFHAEAWQPVNAHGRSPSKEVAWTSDRHGSVPNCRLVALVGCAADSPRELRPRSVKLGGR